MSKLVSIVVPVYNVEKYLERCVDSLINQTYKNIEVIVADNHSTDNSYELIKKYQTTHDPDYLNDLIIKYSPFLWGHAKMRNERMNGNVYDLQDLFQEACIAFGKAVEAYDMNAEASITTYARSKIRHALDQYERQFRQEWSVTQEYFEFDQTIYRCIKEVDPGFIKGVSTLSNQEIEMVIDLLVADLKRKYHTTTSKQTESVICGKFLIFDISSIN